ncbi:hypothetical protein C446_03164 [Halobiforma nitratireducens JCM 10879]|uniref:Uncharacterized protein n=1 Tax=Halobiforma nitratireducens JCM 10879 TaxID=1227454 RepID=M0MD64_9EURY|nr:hypothetical protein C446_03164 [Halobiforma nitratireducens JCM 10879]
MPPPSSSGTRPHSGGRGHAASAELEAATTPVDGVTEGVTVAGRDCRTEPSVFATAERGRRGTTLLGFLDESHDPRQRRLVAGRGDADTQAPFPVRRPADDLVPGLFLDGSEPSAG